MRSTSLCLFVDGTEQDFPGLLAKASQHFTEVCVVDLSPDGASLEAATAGGALACRYRWSDHPSEALNTGLDLACGDWVLVASGSEVERLEELYGPTDDIPRGPEGKVLRSHAKTADFMIDDSFTTDVEFQAVELSLWGKSTL